MFPFDVSKREDMSLFAKIRSLLGEAAKSHPDAGAAMEVPIFMERRARPRRNCPVGMRVLVVDDSKTILVALRRMLRSIAYTPIEAEDGETALELARKEQPDLIFLDIILPGMNGFAALRLLRKDPLTSKIPVILMSGNEQAATQFFASSVGADDFMKKPFSRFEVFARIEKLIEANRLDARDEEDSLQA